MLFAYPEVLIVKVLRTSGVTKEFIILMLTEFVMISFNKPGARKTLNINTFGYANNIIIEYQHYKK